MPLAEAATRRGIDVAEVALRIACLGRCPGGDYPPDTAGLIDHIVRRYHRAHHRDLPGLIRLALRVEAVHSDHPAVPAGLTDTLKRMQDELRPHMRQEQEVLFPTMRIAGGRPPRHILVERRREHARLGAYLQRIEALIGGSRAPAGACCAWQDLCTGVAGLVNDVMEHVHLENNVLFPRFERPGA